MHLKTGCQYVRAIKQSINKQFQTTSSIHKDLANLICSYSHQTLLKPGLFLYSTGSRYFVVKKIVSKHFCLGYFVPSFLRRLYLQAWTTQGPLKRKRIFHPFTAPEIHLRKNVYIMPRKGYEPLSYSQIVFG
jgi:hypothetical protein